jgi:radical SAM-linked protein
MLAGRETAAGPLTGEGNAEEWLGAVPSSLEPPTAAAPVVQRVRVRYRKIGPARFIGTRELGTIFARAVRRARLPVGFSNGHHPLPRIGFGPALPVGVSSDDELVDLELTAPCAPADVLSVLARELPDGLLPLAADEIARSAPSIDQSTTGNLYDVDVAELDEPPTPDAVAAAVERFHASDRLLVRKHTKGGERLVDGRPLVVSLAQTGPATLALELAAGPAGTLKPNMVVAALLDLPADAAPLLRIHKRTTRFASDPAARDAASLV